MHSTLAITAIALAIISYSFYLRDIFAGKTKPHGFTWLTWSALNTFVFYQQLLYGGGPGAWITGVAAIANGAIFLLAFKYGERNITQLDWICLAGAVIALLFWWNGVSPAPSIVIACIVFALGFIPTIRKSLRKVYEETAITFGLNAIKFLIALLALQSFTLITALYPAVLFTLNAGFAIFLFTQQHRPRKR